NAPPQHQDPATPPSGKVRPPTSSGTPAAPLPPAQPWTTGAPEDVPAAQNWVAATPPQDAPTPQLSLSAQTPPPAAPQPQPVASTRPQCACVNPGFLAAVPLPVL